MDQPDPIAIANNDVLVFLRRGLPGRPPLLRTTWREDEIWFRTFQGRKSQLPGVESMTTICNVHRSTAARDQFSATAHDALGIDLNNLACLLILEGKDPQAFELLAEAEVAFKTICNLFGKPVAPAVLQQAVALYNLATIYTLGDQRDPARRLYQEAAELLGGVPEADRGLGHGFITAAIRAWSS